MTLDCVIYCAFYSILFRGAVFSGHGVVSYSASAAAAAASNKLNVDDVLFTESLIKRTASLFAHFTFVSCHALPWQSSRDR